WDTDRLWAGIRSGFDRASAGALDGVGIDTWGVDYALVDDRGELVQKPFHYRDTRTARAMDEVLARVGRDRLYDVTGIQFLPFNTLFQLHTETADVLRRARTLLTMPDFFNHRLTGR